MVFQRFTHTGRGFKAKASVRSNGQIGFSHGAIRRFALDEFSHAVLYYDPENRLVGVKPTNDANEEGAIKLNVKENTAWIAATAFLDYHNLPYTKTTRYDLEADTLDEHPLMVFRIGDGSPEDASDEADNDDPPGQSDLATGGEEEDTTG